MQLRFVNAAPLPRRALAARTSGLAESGFDLERLGTAGVQLKFPAVRARPPQARAHRAVDDRALWAVPLLDVAVPAVGGRRSTRASPARAPLPAPGAGRLARQSSASAPGEDEWAGLRAYQAGDSPRSIAWKSWARGAPLMVAQYAGSGGSDYLFSFRGLEALDLESRLSQLAAWIGECGRLDAACGLALPGADVPLGRGAAHRRSPAASARPVRRGGAMNWLQGGRGAAVLPIAALSLAALVNAHHLAWWCLPLLALAMGWHSRAVLRGFPQPGRVARIGFALLVTAGVLLSYHTLNGLSAGATLLAAMTAAKLFEARSRRDWYVISGATLFLLLAACLDRQQLWRLPLYALSLWLIAASLREPLWRRRDSGRHACCANPRAAAVRGAAARSCVPVLPAAARRVLGARRRR